MFAGVGERTREGNDLYNEMKVGGVITDDYKTSKVVLNIISIINLSPLIHFNF